MNNYSAMPHASQECRHMTLIMTLSSRECLHALLDLTHNSVLAHVILYYTSLFMCLSPSSWMWAP